MDVAAQKAKAEAFRAMHHAPEILVLCNTSDVAASRVVVEAGFPAVATSSAGIAWFLGHPDGENISRDDMLFMVRRIAAAVDVPVTADMEAGYGATPEDVAASVRSTIEAGAVGINIEDSDPGTAGHPLLDTDHAVARIRAARAAADATGVPMVINARTDGFFAGASAEVFVDTVRRAEAYLAAGADSIFVPFVRDEETIAALVADIDGPVNILAAAPSPPIPRLDKIGVRRVSIGGLLGCAAAALVRRAAHELKGPGTYGFAADVILHPEMNKLVG